MTGPMVSSVDPSIPRGNMFTSPVTDNKYCPPDGTPLNGLYYICSMDGDEGHFRLDINIAE